MDLILAQIKLHKDIIAAHDNYIRYLTQLRDERIHNEKASNEIAINEKICGEKSQSNNTDSKIGEHSYEDNISPEAIAKSIEGDDNDIIWDRIQRARLAQLEQLELNTAAYSNENPSIKEDNIIMPAFPRQTRNNLPISNTAPLEVKIHTQNSPENNQPNSQKNETASSHPLVTCLSKYPQKKQNEIIKNIFLKAKSNIERLAELDINIKNNLEAEIHAEADKLLAAYLSNN